MKKNKKFIYLISPNKILSLNFYKHLERIFKTKKIVFFQLRLKNENNQKIVKIAKKITPVPGGVGPMTIACLMHNTVKAAYINKKNEFINVLEGIL